MDSDKRLTYIQKISLNNKTEEEKERIYSLFNANKNIAYKVASKYYKTYYWDFEESLQIAQLGLFKACLIWDPEKYRLSTLAYNIINRDFIDFDKQQKRQPTIILNLEESINTADNIVVGDLISDRSLEKLDIEEQEDVDELKQDIIYILEDISEEFGISTSVSKLIYLIYLETGNIGSVTTRLKCIKRETIILVINKLQEKLNKMLEV